ncbi:MAG: succinylglutamate-semialdehyde dehydrogenase [Pseudomonadota bacterium]
MSARDVFIDGAWESGEGVAFESVCPATGAVSWSGHGASPQQVVRAVTGARAAFDHWSVEPRQRRAEILVRYRDQLAARKSEIAETISRDMGKVLWDAAGEAGAMIGKIDLSSAAQSERAGTKETEAAFGRLQLDHRPHGVMAVFGPFNFPGHLPNGHIVPALLAGNTCVFKPSELAPAVANIMIECLVEAGLPPGCLNLVHGGRDTGAALLESDLDGVLFTGSAKTGIAFHRHFAGRPEIILALEMGGNNPLVAWPPCDAAAAADIIAQGAFLTTGQRCSCTRRLILPEGKWGDDVLSAVAARAEAIRIGPWSDETAFMGPLVSAQAAVAACTFQDMLMARGGRPVVALTQQEPGLGFVSPGIIDVTEAQDVPDEELFGPLIQVTRVATLEQAFARANATKYGLAGGVVCDDDEVWQQSLVRMRAGILNRNRPTAGASGALPFGGSGLSGNHRASAWYAADYCAWPQASQVAPKAARMQAVGFPE